MDLGPLPCARAWERRRPARPEVPLNPLTPVRTALSTTGSSARLVWHDRDLRRVDLALVLSAVGADAEASARADALVGTRLAR